MTRLMVKAAFLSAVVGLAACAGESGEVAPSPAGTLEVGAGDVTKTEIGKADSSVEAVFVDFNFEGELLTKRSFNPKGQIDEQLLYTIGHLNGDRSVGRLDKVALTEIKTEAAGELTRVTYTATLQVAWGKKNNVPATYELILPRDVSLSGLEKFTESYNRDCVDFGAHDVTTGSMWYYYRPHASRCKLDDADVVRLTAEVSISDVNTTGKFPEYHKIWEDGAFNVVAVFGKYEDGAKTNSDAGISAYNRFSQSIRSELKSFDLTTTPERIPSNPGVDIPEVRYEAIIDGGHKVVVTALLVDNVRTAGRDFDQRYGELSRDADLIVYNGHAGLGSNIRALARKGDWVTGQYAMIFMNGCDTYTYIDASIFDAHAAVNDDDDTGTKYADLITNAMPSFFRSMPAATMALVRGVLSFDDPQTYEQMFLNIDRSEIVIVTGEQDNVYVPGFGDTDEPIPTVAWEGLELGGSVSRDEERRFVTPMLPAGTYTFMMDGTNDADLYIRVGLEPSTQKYGCRPFKSGSKEVCEVELSTEAVIHGMVRGWAGSSDFDLVGVVE